MLMNSNAMQRTLGYIFLEFWGHISDDHGSAQRLSVVTKKAAADSARCDKGRKLTWVACAEAPQTRWTLSLS